MRQRLLYRTGIICFTFLGTLFLLDEVRDQFGELQEVGNPDWRAPPTDDDFWIRCHDVGPLTRHRADLVFVNSQEKTRPVPVVTLTDADELPSLERMERMSDAHKTRPCVRRACSS